MTFFYGYNPSGGVHRYTHETGVFEYYSDLTRSWVPVEFDQYRGWITWVDLAEMPAEVREVECMSWVIPDADTYQETHNY